MTARLRRLFPALLVAALLVPAGAAAKPLEHGSHGSRVKRLQRDLGLPADGVFGSGTLRAVRRFQRTHDIPVDGVVGKATWRMIRRARAAHGASTSSSARVQSRGGSVRALQRRLGIAADGVFGPGTARAVRTYQRSRGLTADGIVGPGTWQALGVTGTHPVLRRAGRASTAALGGVPRHVVLLARARAAGDRIATLPYVYGGGHGSFHAAGYDCSGSVSYVLHAIGRLSVPMDSGELMSYGAAGPGRYITVYANPSHAFMVVDGRRFDTSGRYGNGSRWQPDDRSSAGYTARHPVGL
jgi:peptidoglycan hydrolase-like protein with peptidoglycan-binding domain